MDSWAFFFCVFLQKYFKTEVTGFLNIIIYCIFSCIYFLNFEWMFLPMLSCIISITEIISFVLQFQISHLLSFNCSSNFILVALFVLSFLIFLKKLNKSVVLCLYFIWEKRDCYIVPEDRWCLVYTLLFLLKMRLMKSYHTYFKSSIGTFLVPADLFLLNCFICHHIAISSPTTLFPNFF